MRNLALLALFLIPMTTLAAPTFTLTEYLGENWSQELVSFPVTIPAELDPERLAVKDGEGQPRMAQFVAEAPGSRTGKVYFLADLGPYDRLEWTLVSGDTLGDMPPKVINLEGQRLEWLLPGRRPTVVLGEEGAAGQAPVQLLTANGATLAAGTLHTPFKIVNCSREVLASGPVFTKVRLTYTFEGDKHYVCEITVIAGQPVVLISERSDLMEKPEFLQGTRPADAPEGNYVMQAYGPRLREQGAYWTLSLEGLQPDRIAWQPMGNVWGKQTVEGEPWGTFPRSREPGPLVTLNPSHGEWWMNVAQ